MQVRQQQQFIRTKSPVKILLEINILFFILQLLTIPKGGSIINSSLTQLFQLAPSKVMAGEVWRIVTSMFLHGSLAHILFNMYALMIFGPLIEQKIGRKRFWIAYFVSGIIAALAYLLRSFLIGSTTPALGASGAIMGILGLVIVLLPQLKVLFFFVVPMSMRTAGILFALMDFVGLFNKASNVAHIAHLGGFAVGLLFGWWLLKKKKIFTQQFTRTGFRTAHAHSNKSIFKQNTSTKSSSSTKPKDYSQTIELTKDDLDDYFKYGKL